MATLTNTTINDTGFLQLPVGNTGQRPSSEVGQMRFNTTTGKPEFFTAGSSAWVGTNNTSVVATGGNSVYDVDVDGVTYRVHVFTSTGSNSFSVSHGGRAEYLIVAGGGSGGSGEANPAGDSPGGGGAGGLLTGFITVTPQTYTIVVGAGASTQVTGTSQAGSAGQNSSAFGLTAIGGGAGAGEEAVGGAGGSGGGGGGSCISGRKAGGAATAGQGNAGGTGGDTGCSRRAGAGGGGAGAAGYDDRGNLGGNGGNGLLLGITGIYTYYAGGGGGGNSANVSGTPGAGGLGGGGAGGQSTGASGSPSGAGTDATPNTGGGGGATGSGTSIINGLGGSGIVVVRYPLGLENPVTAAGKITEDGLVLDFANSASYVGTGTVVNNSKLNGFTGTITGSLTSFINVRTHRSAFRGSITAGNDISMDPRCIPVGNEITILFWNFGRTQQSSSIIAASHNSSSQTLNIHLPWVDGNVYWDCGEPFNRQAFGISTIYTGWRHWVFTHNANTGIKRIYNAGVEVNAVSGQTSSIPAMTVCRIGGYWTGSNYGHDGDIGMCRIYNREITVAEVLAHYNATRWRFGV